MTARVALVGVAALALAAARTKDPCVRPARAGTQVQGDVRVCPGYYRIPDRAERGVIVAAGSGTRIDLSGVTLDSGDSMPSRAVGAGVVSRGVDAVSVMGGTIRGYRAGVRIDGGRGHRVSGTAIDSGGLSLRDTQGAIVTGLTVRGGSTGIDLAGARGSYLADNSVSGSARAGIGLRLASHNVIVRNRVSGAAAGMLIEAASDSNSVVDNDVSGSAIGLVISGRDSAARAPVGNLVRRNIASRTRVGFSITRAWANVLVENRVDSSGGGFVLERASGTTLRANTIVGAGTGIVSNQGTNNTILANVVVGGGTGVRVWAPAGPGAPSRGYRVDDNVFAKLAEGIVLTRTTNARVRGNLFDGVGSGLIVDEAGRSTEVTGNIFLRATRWFIEAPELAAGGNYWGTTDAAAAASKVHGKIDLRPWRPASAAGY